MSTIKTLSIRGVRSFGTEKEDEQKITFSSPVTLIVGENGCGKTTVIECLKYALTGDMPPGSERGKTFIHDPKVFRSDSAYGQVKLQVTDTLGRQKTCVRSMKTDVQKNGKTKFATLDSTIMTEDENGKREETGRRVEEVNNEMAISMGVSKAILNNVIFCHQEESLWPMDEGKKLKEKFDAIFGTTEYNKAIDKILKNRKDYQARLATCVHEKRFLGETKRDADRKKLEHEKLTAKHEKMAERLKQLDETLKPIADELEKIDVKRSQIGELQGQQTALSSKIDHCKTNIANTRKKIKTLLDSDVDELQDQLKTFLETQKRNENQLIILSKEYQKLSDEEKRLREVISTCKNKIERLSDHYEKMQELEDERRAAISDLSKELEIDLQFEVSQSLTPADLGSATDQITRKISDKEENLKQVKSKEDDKDAEFQQQIDKVRVEKTEFETNLKTQGDRISKLSSDQKQVRQEISAIEASMPRMNQLITQIETAEKELKKTKNENNIEDLEDDKDVAATEKAELEEKLSGVDAEVEKLESVSKITSELELKERELVKDQSDFDRTKSKQSSTLKQLFPKPIDRNYKNNVQALKDKLTSEVQQLKSSLEDTRASVSRLQMERDHLRKQQKLKEGELEKTREKIYSVCDGEDYMNLLTSQKEKVDKLNLDLAYHKSSESTFKRYLRDIEQEPDCPLCHKHLESNEPDQLKDEIHDLLRELPNKIKHTEKQLKDESKKYYSLNELKSSYDGIEKAEKDAKQLTSDLKNCDTKYQNNKSLIEDLEMQLAEPDSKLNVISQIFFSDMCRLDELAKTIAVKASEIVNLKGQIPAEMPSKSLAVAKAELRQLTADVKAKNDLVNQLNQKINSTHSTLNALQDNLNQMVSQKMQQQEKIQGLDRMRAQLKEQEKEKSELERTMKEDERKLQPIKDKLNGLIEKKQKAKEEARKTIHDLDEVIKKLKLSQIEIDRISKDIETYENMNLLKRMEEDKAKVEDCTKRADKLHASGKSKAQEINQLNEAVVNHESAKRNLEDNLELQRYKVEQEEAEEEYRKLKQTVGEFNVKKLIRDYKDLNEKQQKIIEERQTTRGQVKESEDRIASAFKEINEPRYKSANANFLKECYKEAVLKAMLDDLHKYRAALERSLMKFHGDKMSQINQTIRELWNNIYRGNDIDYIMIKTDEGESKTVSEKKRSFNYRVVQAKNGGSEIDMRGRCSAGQKVLASLIIRMALADTFSANCGILALDEPTTNLDQKNIEALCAALSKIIEEREKMGNFMLVIITHDEAFVTSMERAEHYFRLTRSNKGKSRIDKVQNM